MESYGPQRLPMSKHSNREKEILLYLQKKYPEIRLWRFDTGQAYAKFSLKACLQEYKRTKSITQAMKKLVIITYGTKGFPDLAGLYKGVFIGIEIKVGKDRQREEQKVMEQVINKAQGIYILLTDKKPIDEQIERIEQVKIYMEEK